MPRRDRQLSKNTRGAIAPMVGLSLFALIACGGIAFDFARMATMDTELQQAADQAALAAATQLDRADGSRARAAKAIQDPVAANRLAANITRFANDGDADGVSVEIESITFCSEFDDSVADTAAACTATTDDNESRFVVVTTSARTANYAFTPVVAAFSSGEITATAVAGVESSICNVAPLLVCAPDNSFPTPDDIGKGLLMKVAGGNSWAPGNYGFLDFGNGNPAVIDALMGHGLNGCQSTDDNETEPGNKNATDAINTRMDVYDGSPATKNPSACNLADGSGCPAPNTRKDMTLAMTYEIKLPSTDPKPTPPNCGAPAGPNLTYADDFALNATAKGFGRDTCHYSGTCAGGNFGNGTWDITNYLAANHPGVSAATIAIAVGGGKTATTLTRFDVYTWELENAASGRLDPFQVGATVESSKVQGPNTTWTFVKQCAFSEAKLAPGAYPVQKDRRILPVVAADCTNLKGKGAAFEDYILLRVFDVFLTEPSMNRTDPEQEKEIYGEILGPAETFAGTSGFQYYSRNRPYLIR